jgi:uncharacterized BrkB/YihY/UPF0761 family membrane protein
MIYIKSFFAGLCAAMFAGLVVFVIGIVTLIVLNIMSKDKESSIGFDIIGFGRSALGIAIGALAFIAGFFWEYLRVSRV